MSATPLRLLFFAAALSAASATSAVDFATQEWGGKRIITCRVDLKRERLQLFLRDENGRPFNRLERLASWLQSRGQKLPFAMNAGMYHGDFTPVGLFVSEGHELTPLNTSSAPGNFFLKPNGVFLIGPRGAAVVETSEYPKIPGPITLATQLGPLLLRRGQIHPAFRPNSQNRLIRNGVGVPSPGVVIFAISQDPVTFHEFATFFRDSLQCPDALFLDGTVSSLHSPSLNRSDFRMDLGPIIGVVE